MNVAKTSIKSTNKFHLDKLNTLRRSPHDLFRNIRIINVILSFTTCSLFAYEYIYFTCTEQVYDIQDSRFCYWVYSGVFADDCL